MDKRIGEKDGLGRLLPTHQSSFNDINMWYKAADPGRTSRDTGALEALVDRALAQQKK
ncbi:MAG: hypothetical protein LUO89_13775 [Methanothrix sp.]|nr:hypothetical protein [Methanothrix sp.]